MSVPQHMRSESRVEFLNTFKRMTTNVMFILMRDFGIKSKHYSLDIVKQMYGITDDDVKTLDDLMLKYNMSSLSVEKYPDWLVNQWRAEVMSIVNSIGISIYCANAIYITNIQEYYSRRNHWNEAIGLLYSLSAKLHQIIDVLKKDVSLGAYEEVFVYIDKEISLIKAVRKSDNKKLTPEMKNMVSLFDNSFIYNQNSFQPVSPTYNIDTKCLELNNKGSN